MIKLTDLSPAYQAEARAALGKPPRPKRAKRDKTAQPAPQSDGERALLVRIRQLGLPEPEPQFKLRINGRLRRFDFGYGPPHNLVVEVQGGAGNVVMDHSSYAGMSRDYAKFAGAIIQGYRVLCMTTAQATDGSGALWIAEALKMPNGDSKPPTSPHE